MPRTPDYAPVLARTLSGLEHDIAQKPRNDKHVRLLWYAVRALSRLAPVDVATAAKLEALGSRLGKPYGLTDAIRSAQFIAGRPAAPLEILVMLEATGFDLRRYT